MRDELQKKGSNIDRQTVKKEDNHDHNNLVSYQCIKYLLNLPKYCVIEITTPVDCPWVSLVGYNSTKYLVVAMTIAAFIIFLIFVKFE